MNKLPNVVSFRISDTEFWALRGLCDKCKVKLQDMLRAILIDALVDEGYDALRCQQPERREGGGEASETCGATTP